MARTEQVRCEICGEAFDSRDDLDAHNARHHKQSAIRGGSASSQDAERDSGAGRVRRDEEISDS